MTAYLPSLLFVIFLLALLGPLGLSQAADHVEMRPIQMFTVMCSYDAKIMTKLPQDIAYIE